VRNPDHPNTGNHPAELDQLDFRGLAVHRQPCGELTLRSCVKAGGSSGHPAKGISHLKQNVVST
jgi:hypothetical protein